MGPLNMRAWILVMVTASVIGFSNQVPGQVNQAAEPTKADLIKTLESIYPLLEAKKYDAAAQFVIMPPGMKPDVLEGILGANELSIPGINLLARDAKFGKATDLFGPERAASLAKKMGADVDQCYGFYHQTEEATAEIIAQWDGAQFKLVRIDDVGKLEPAPTEKRSDKKIPGKEMTGNRMPDEVASTDESNERLEKESREAIIRKAAMALADLQVAVDQNPADINARAKLAMAMYQVGNYPAAWLQLMAAYQVDPAHNGIVRGIDTLIGEFTKQGVFTVGVPPETIQALLGEPTEKMDLKMRTRWRYAHWCVDFSDGRVGEIMDLRGAKKSWFEPTEKISTDLGGQTWLVGFRRKEKGKAVVFYFVPGETMSNHTQLVTVERLHDIPGTLEENVRQLIEDEEVLVPDSMHRVLVPGEDSVIMAAKIPAKEKSQTRHQLIRLWRGPKDLHRLTYTIVSADEPTQETQKQWLEIFQKATLDPVK